jgi:hypothetical protein
MGIRGTRQILDVLLAPWGDRAVNLAGNLGISAMAALLQLCAGHVGGSPLFLSMAKACGCAHAPLAAAGRTLDAAEGEG